MCDKIFVFCLSLPVIRARYGVQLEKGPFERRTADFLWMIIFGALSLLVCIGCTTFTVHLLHGLVEVRTYYNLVNELTDFSYVEYIIISFFFLCV